MKTDDVTDIIVQLATYIEEDDWEEVFAFLLEMNELSFKQGYLLAVRTQHMIGKNLSDI